MFVVTDIWQPCHYIFENFETLLSHLLIGRPTKWLRKFEIMNSDFFSKTSSELFSALGEGVKVGYEYN